MDKKLNNDFIALLMPFLIFYLIDLLFCGYNSGMYLSYASLKTQIFSCIILYSIFSFLTGLCKNTHISTIIMSIFLVVLLFMNLLKIEYLEEPIMLEDILYLKNSDEIMDLASTNIGDVIKKIIPHTIIYSVFSICICMITRKFKIKIENKKYRMILIFCPIILFSILFMPFSFIKNFMLKNIYDKEKINDYGCFVSNVSYYCCYGVFPGIYGQYLENCIFEPPDYDEDAIYKAVANIKEDSKDKSFGKPNIIVFFGESFWDVDLLDEVQFSDKITSNFNELKDNGIFFNMISPTYGGISANVEFEFLTGANLMYFNKGYIPYMFLYNDDTYYNRPTIIQELKNNGYKTKLTTYTSQGLFNCGKVYKYMGIDETEFVEDISKENKKGYYVSDEYVIDNFINDFDNKKDDEKLFYMFLTMQAHMPYSKKKYEKYDISITKSKLDEEMNDVLLAYAQGIYDTDKQLGRLYEYIQTINEPTIIIFFGDHLPYLQTKNGDNVLNNLEYFNTDDDLLNYYRKYNTQSLILANFEIKDENTKFLGPDLLGCYVLNKMDIEISDYYKWLYSNKYKLCSSNYYISSDSLGNLYYTNDLKGNLKELYDLRKNIQYKYFVK